MNQYDPSGNPSPVDRTKWPESSRSHGATESRPEELPPAINVDLSAGSTSPLEKKQRLARFGANWLLFIALLSIINSIALGTGGERAFSLGLRTTLLVDIWAGSSASGGNLTGGISPLTLALVLNSLVAAVFVGCWIMARQLREWAFLLGMALYAADGLIMMQSLDLRSIIIHGFVLLWICLGYLALLQAREMEGKPNGSLTDNSGLS